MQMRPSVTSLSTRTTGGLTVWAGAIVERQAPRVLVWAVEDVGLARIPAARPPAAFGRLRDSFGAVCARTFDGGRPVRDVDALEFLHPLLHLRSVCARAPI